MEKYQNKRKKSKVLKTLREDLNKIMDEILEEDKIKDTKDKKKLEDDRKV